MAATGLAVVLVGAWSRRAWRQRRRRLSLEGGAGTPMMVFVPWDAGPGAAVEDDGRTLVVDCTHPVLPALTHHKGGSGALRSWVDAGALCSKSHHQEHGATAGDSSTDIILDALALLRGAGDSPDKRSGGSSSSEGRSLAEHVLLSRQAVSCNHYDIDGLAAVYGAMHAESLAKAPAQAQLLRAVARLGDFRDMSLASEPWRDAALKVCCFLNSDERRLFSRPFSKLDKSLSEQKWTYFLGELGSVLGDPDLYTSRWQDEYQRVKDDLQCLADLSFTQIRRYDDLGLAVVDTAAAAPHYYALFTATSGFDVVLTMYRADGAASSGASGTRYEVEQKYTQYVDLRSRPTLPRWDLRPLADLLNKLEHQLGDDLAQDQPRWVCDRYTDSGPLLRLEAHGRHLSKEERYGHPYERPMPSSHITPEQMEESVLVFLRARPSAERKFNWTWKELHDLNCVAA